jgi:cytochrome c553
MTTLSIASVLAVCVTCHGALGEGSPGGVPRLAGQDAQYLSHALAMFKDGTRASAIMQPIARGLGDDEIAALADHFSAERAPLVDAPAASSASVLAGERLAQAGAGDVLPCFSCHGAQGIGAGARFPRIAGQPAAFVVSRLHEFQDRARHAAPQPLTMTAVSTTLNESQVEDVAAYLSSIPGQP